MYCSINRWVYFRERERKPPFATTLFKKGMGLLGLLSGGYGAVQVMNDYPLTPVSLSSHAPYSKTSRWKVLIYYSYHISSTRCCSQIVAMASIHDAETRVPSDAHWAISRVACVLRLASMADSRTERLCVLLPASIRPSCIACMYLIQLSLLSFGFPTN